MRSKQQQVDEADSLGIPAAPLVRALERWYDAKQEMAHKPDDLRARSAFWRETDRLDRSFAKWIGEA